MQNSGPALVVVLALASTLYFLGAWLPERVAREHDQLIANRLKKENPAIITDPAERVSSSTGLSEDLLQYIKKQREQAKSLSDQLDPVQVEKVELSLAEQAPADEILRDKFARFFKTPVEATSSDEFIVTDQLKGWVGFWTRIFGVYGRDHVIFYHPDNVEIVYSVLDFSELGQFFSSIEGVRQQMISEERQRIVKMIRKVSGLIKKPVMTDEERNKLPEEEKRLYSLLKKNLKTSEVDAGLLTKSLAYRTGFSHRIKNALVQSGRYMPEMRRIFGEKGLPVELTVIPFFESAFNVRAYSRSHAAGIWQFIPQTGKRYLRIDEFVDERYDPILATHAAASHLAHEYNFLKSWPLTVNAYNTGPGRMLDAVQKLGTNDIAAIIKGYRGSGYGFDSRNYYPEFLAMLYVYNHREDYFDDVELLPVEKYEYIAMPATTNLRNLVHMAGIEEEILQKMNPGFSDSVIEGKKPLPKGYLLKVPPLLKDGILLAAKELYQSRLYASYHVVQDGEGLSGIAKRYNVSEKELARLNRIIAAEDIRDGDILKLPVEDFEDAATATLPTF